MKATRVCLEIVNKLGRKLGKLEALLHYGADLSIADEHFMNRLGLEKEHLKPPIKAEIRGATQNPFNMLGSIKLKIKYGKNLIEDTIVVAKDKVAAPLLVRCDISCQLRSDRTYPKILQVGHGLGLSNPVSTSDLTEQNVLENSTVEEIEKLKQNYWRDRKSTRLNSSH